MSKSHFYAYMARMRLIKRWSLRRSTIEENDQEHSLQVAMIAHALAVIAESGSPPLRRGAGAQVRHLPRGGGGHYRGPGLSDQVL
jgi:hypothetical protein